ncbi:17S U2 SnRNP complex component HTATSF1-like [Mytilus trossulus]|uniref:17S U2 SnRNP complex component HTATSF1-like n=1 Tax=Mytilus trossulus TaxID=6551 RepID=UPI00300623D6
MVSFITFILNKSLSLYTVEKYWSTTGQSGLLVWKFALRRCTDQPPPPWTYEGDGQSLTEEIKSGFDSDETTSQISSSQSSSQSDETTTHDGKDGIQKNIKNKRPEALEENEEGDGQSLTEEIKSDSGFDSDETANGKDEIQKKIKSERQEAPEKEEKAKQASEDLNELKTTDQDTNGKCDQNATDSNVYVSDAKQNLKDEPKKKTTMKGNKELKGKVELMETESNEKVLDTKMEDGDMKKTGKTKEGTIGTNDSTELQKEEESENKIAEESVECKSDLTEKVNEIEAA